MFLDTVNQLFSGKCKIIFIFSILTFCKTFGSHVAIDLNDSSILNIHNFYLKKLQKFLDKSKEKSYKELNSLIKKH